MEDFGIFVAIVLVVVVGVMAGSSLLLNDADWFYVDNSQSFDNMGYCVMLHSVTGRSLMVRNRLTVEQAIELAKRLNQQLPMDHRP